MQTALRGKEGMTEPMIRPKPAASQRSDNRGNRRDQILKEFGRVSGLFSAGQLLSGARVGCDRARWRLESRMS